MDNLEKAECEFNDPHDVTPMYLEHFKDVTDSLRNPKIAERVSDELNKAISGEFTYRFPITEGITLFCKELSQKEIKNLQKYFTICNTTVKGDEIAMQLEFHDMVIQMTDSEPVGDFGIFTESDAGFGTLYDDVIEACKKHPLTVVKVSKNPQKQLYLELKKND